MPCHILCPSCGNGLSEVYEFIDVARQGYYKSQKNGVNDVNVDKLKISPDISKPIGFILDAAGLKFICCRMHILGVTDFDSVYK